MKIETKGRLLMASSAAALLLFAQAPAAHAAQTVASIFGIYDAECGSNITCTNANPLFSGATSFSSNSVPGGGYDTPALFIYNQSGQSMTNVDITLTGYQGRNNSVVKSFGLPNIAAGEVYELYWNDGYGGTIAGDLFSYDYDDEYGSTQHGGGNKLPACDPQPYNICAYVGNFDVKLTASTGSNPNNTADFSPDNTQGGGNQQGTFVGWEGLDPSGLSETAYDDHASTVEGVLAYMYTGTTGRQTSAVPEPATLAITGAGVAALAFARRRRKRKTA